MLLPTKQLNITANVKAVLDAADYAAIKALLDLEIGTDVLAQQAIGIANDNLVEIDSASVADNDYAKFTANGLEGRSYSEVRTDLGLGTGDSPQFTGLTLTGDLTVSGTTTTINSTTLTVDDKNIELGSVASPTDSTADGGGITLKGATDKTIIWDNANDNWSFNQSVNVSTGLEYKVNNVSVLSSTTLGSSVVSSSLTSVGTITSGVWHGTAIGDTYISSAATWNAKQAALTFGIANTNAVKIDSASVVNGEYARFTANGLESRSVAEVQGDLSVDDLITLSGVSSGATTLGTFTGTTIADNQTIKAALQALETAVEGAAGTINIVVEDDNPSGSTGASTNFDITLSNSVSDIYGVHINGVPLHNSEFSASGTTLTLNVPYATDTSDVVTTTYSY
jgi:hypothetical protein